MNPFASWAHAAPVLLLCASNLFMTFAWYGHLKFRSAPLFGVILASWGIAFFEYCLAVPANRIGYGTFTGQQLKVMQEVITLAVFGVFSVAFLGETIRQARLESDQTHDATPPGVEALSLRPICGL